jgi:hypothetical protein
MRFLEMLLYSGLFILSIGCFIWLLIAVITAALGFGEM